MLLQCVEILTRLGVQVMPDQEPHLLDDVVLQLLAKLYNFFVAKSSFMPTAPCSAELSATMRPGCA